MAGERLVALAKMRVCGDPAEYRFPSRYLSLRVTHPLFSPSAVRRICYPLCVLLEAVHPPTGFKMHFYCWE